MTVLGGLKVHLKMLKYIYYRILIRQDIEYLRCVINEVRSALSTCYRVGDSLLSVVILHSTSNMVGIVL